MIPNLALHPHLLLVVQSIYSILSRPSSISDATPQPVFAALLNLAPACCLRVKQLVVDLCLLSGSECDEVKQGLHSLITGDPYLLTRCFDNLTLNQFPDYRLSIYIPREALQSGLISQSCFDERFVIHVVKLRYNLGKDYCLF